MQPAEEVIAGYPRPQRDVVLRLAHQRAFQKISVAGGQTDGHEAVARAVEELIDACEAYVSKGL